MKKSIIALGLIGALSAGIANADVIDNDVDQWTESVDQFNAVVDISLLSIGPTVFSGVNGANISTQPIIAIGDAYDNDVTQVAGFVEQRNSLVSLSFGDVGRTVFDGTNVINQAEVKIDALDDVKDTDVVQDGSQITQTNGLVQGHLADVGKTKFTGANIVNSADVRLEGARNKGGDTEEVDDNDVKQEGFEILQANRVVHASSVKTGKIKFDGTNVINTVEVDIDAEDADSNDVDQWLLGDTVQYNALVVLSNTMTGRVLFSGTNAGNIADVEIDLEYGAGDDTKTASSNDIDQEAFDATQVNVVLKGTKTQLGKIKFDGTNVINQASLDIHAGEIGHSLYSNDIDQVGEGLTQVNAVGLGHQFLTGKVKFTGVNVVNSADLKLRASGNITSNDVDQSAVGITQVNGLGNLTGSHLGKTSFSGTNLINTSTVSIAP